MRQLPSHLDGDVDVDVDLQEADEATGVQMVSRDPEPERIGPYALYEEIGCGGMATVHLGQLRSASGFTRTVAIKRMHTELARSPEFVAMFFDEARLAGRLQHPNVVAALDCVVCDGTTLLVMDYVHGASLDEALHLASQAGESIPLPVVSAILIGALLGLHAAHEAVDDDGKSLGIVHRDVSPHNILIGADGLARVLDFGIAKAAERAHHTRTGEVKGKLGYMSPEQLFNDEGLGREADIYSVGVILWEILAGRRLFANESHGQTLMRVANGRIESPRSVRTSVSPELDAITMKALCRQPKGRFRTAREFAIALETACPPAHQRVVGDWLAALAEEPLRRRWALKCGVDSSRDRPRDATASGVRENITSRFRQPLTRAPEERGTATTINPATIARRKMPLVAIVGAVAIASATVGSLISRLTVKAPVAAAQTEATTFAPRVEEPPPVMTAAATPPPNVDPSPAVPPAPESLMQAKGHPSAPHAVYRARTNRPVSAGSSPGSGMPPAIGGGPELGAIGGRE